LGERARKKIRICWRKR